MQRLPGLGAYFRDSEKRHAQARLVAGGSLSCLQFSCLDHSAACELDPCYHCVHVTCSEAQCELVLGWLYHAAIQEACTLSSLLLL
jgi:hypothetical protein